MPPFQRRKNGLHRQYRQGIHQGPGLSGTDAGFWYTAFAADAVEGPYVAEADSVRGTGGTLALTLDADAAEHPARFVRVAVSREPCAAGVSLESFLAQ